MNALILAGSTGDEKLPEKALIKIKDRYMISYVIDALRGSGKVDKIAVVGDREKLQCIDGIDILIDQGNSIIENVVKGVEPFKNDRRVLILTCDIPMLTKEAVIDFVEQSEALNADLCYPIVKREDNERKFPDAKRTYAKIKEGTFTGGNIFYINPQIVDACIEAAKQFIAFRKKPWKLGQLLGFRILILFAFGRVTISQLERKVSELFNINAKAVISKYPEIGNDVDKDEDVEMANKYIA
ncbi:MULTISPECIES: nucleotidyltransferase family protein [unclassified Thermoanaerobacterium]|uniref:nucleotidyltransferase family protein n=1 Tax=unclassified Thermoanaerobacterium TaxID=2622527 RepID=UPI000A14DBF5|nr:MULTISPECIES: nucleotidyltransferase family protein [unclassified Thermoanaerobacterium]MDE4543157.1 nucleotidyltransferase family protein [Thermoanaerobacterium sp. R66]ORX23625.1 molybdopterin-guanine dinucleotide biosynthesis protein A [Thermoanaerobacterium sp. PSU-2]HHV74282.1 NTP transferase domain-containing protein [Thermoanaerobacterium sp.]